MKLTNEEITTVMDRTIREVGEAYQDQTKLSPAYKEFGDQLSENKSIAHHIKAILLMEKFAESMEIPAQTSRLASFVAAALIGYKLKEAELAKSEVADLNRMVV